MSTTTSTTSSIASSFESRAVVCRSRTVSRTAVKKWCCCCGCERVYCKPTPVRDACVNHCAAGGFFALISSVSLARVGATYGLQGTFDGDPTNDWRDVSGATLTLSSDRQKYAWGQQVSIAYSILPMSLHIRTHALLFSTMFFANDHSCTCCRPSAVGSGPDQSGAEAPPASAALRHRLRLTLSARVAQPQRQHLRLPRPHRLVRPYIRRRIRPAHEQSDP